MDLRRVQPKEIQNSASVKQLPKLIMACPGVGKIKSTEIHQLAIDHINKISKTTASEYMKLTSSFFIKASLIEE